MKPDEIKLGYLLITTPQPNLYIGGAMVTDGRGLPVEFRYTEPIQPTKIQQILYGQVLNKYIKREVILETLLKNLENKFKCLLVEDENLLTYPAKGFSMIRVTETKSSPLGAVGKFQEISPTEILLQASKEGSPVRVHMKDPIKASPGEETSATPPEEIKLGADLDVLIAAGQHMDVYEPMKRIEKALETICQEEGIPLQTR